MISERKFSELPKAVSRYTLPMSRADLHGTIPWKTALEGCSCLWVSICKSRYNTIIWRADKRTHLSKKTRPNTERSRKSSNVRGIPSRPDDQLRWVLIVRTQVYDMGGELPYSQTSRPNHTIDYRITLT